MPNLRTSPSLHPFIRTIASSVSTVKEVVFLTFIFCYAVYNMTCHIKEVFQHSYLYQGAEKLLVLSYGWGLPARNSKYFVLCQ
jgi:hypothetical protein